MESMSAEKKVSAQLARRNVNDVQARPGRPLPRPGRSDTSDMSDTHGLCGMQPGGTNGQDANISAATQTAFSWTSAKAAKDQFPTAKTKTTCRFHSDTSGLIALITLHQAQRLTVATSRHLSPPPVWNFSDHVAQAPFSGLPNVASCVQSHPWQARGHQPRPRSSGSAENHAGTLPKSWRNRIFHRDLMPHLDVSSPHQASKHMPSVSSWLGTGDETLGSNGSLRVQQSHSSLGPVLP